MKRILTIVMLGLLITSCKQEKRTDYVINGNAEDVYNGIRVYLKEADGNGKEIVKDTAIVMNGKFTMKGVVTEPNIHSITVDGTPGKVVFMLENSEIDIDINKKILAESKVTGSDSNDDFLAFQNGMKDIRTQGMELMRKHDELNIQEGTKASDSFTNALNELREKLTNHPIKFAKENNDSHFSLDIIRMEISRPNADVVKYMEVYDNLSPRLKTSEKAKEIKEQLDELYKEYERVAHLEVGNPAPNFKAPTPDGDMVSLDDLRGKVTIIDFWAAWCGPCRRENPNVVRIYEKYHEKGLEIIGVSLDGQSRQPNPKKAWLEAIESDKLTWNHVSNLKYFNDPVAKLYNIQAIPATYILDSKGTIVAKNLRGKALEDKIQELLEEQS